MLFAMTYKSITTYFLLIGLFLINVLHAQPCDSDATAPVLNGGCPTVVPVHYISDPGSCTLPNPIPFSEVYTEDCQGVFVITETNITKYSFVMGAGGGIMPSVVMNGRDFVMRGINNGTPGALSQANFCFYAYCAGTIEFSFEATMDTGDDFPNDRARIMIENALTGTSTVNVLTPGTGSTIQGTRSIVVGKGDRICFEINSDNTGGVNTLTVRDLNIYSFGAPEVMWDHFWDQDALLTCGNYTAFSMGINCSGRSSICSYNFNVVDTTKPIITGCPANVTLSIPPGECTIAYTWDDPTSEDPCTATIVDFTAHFASDLWKNNLLDPYLSLFSGLGTDAIVTHDAGTLSMTASNNGIPGLARNQRTRVWRTAPCDGTIQFDWTAAIPDPGTFAGDEAGYSINGSPVLLSLPLNTNAANGSVAGVVVNKGDILEFWVESENNGMEVTMDITGFIFVPTPDPTIITQISGPVSGEELNPGIYTVVYEAEACCGIKRCVFTITVDGGEIMACKDLNVSLDQNCEVLITPDAVLTSPCAERAKVILSHYGHPVPNPVDSHYLNKTLTATVIDTVTGNSCWSYVTIEDKLSPTILCKHDTMNCFEFDATPIPADVQDCSKYSVKLLDEQITKLECNPDFIKQITRVWVSTDSRGNVSDTCAQQILIERPDIDSIGYPLDVTINCSDIVELDANNHPHPNETGVPIYGSIEYRLWPTTDFLCNMVVEYEDLDLGEIRCVRKIMRTWRVREWWCNTELTRAVTQVIQIVDDKGPRIIHAPYDFHVTTGHRDCYADVVLPSIDAVDDCHAIFRIDVEYPGGILIGKNGGLAKLPVGIDTVFYRLYDNCYNLTTDTLIVTVKDETQPVAICDRRTVVALNHSGYNWVPAEVFDDGSFDECHLHHFEVRRMDDNACGTTGPDDWGPEVGFCCEDVGSQVMVAFKAIDASGNESVCMVFVEVQDKDLPLISCPPNITVDCRFPIDLNNLSTSFGTVALAQEDRKPIVIDPRYWHNIDGHPQDGLASDNCPPFMREEVDSSGFNNCGLGVIKRWFIATDRQGNEVRCYQTITVENHHPFDDESIVWPADLDTSGICNHELLRPELLSAPYNRPTFSDDVCTLVGSSYHDHVFSNTVPGDPCFKILRIWKVINWCEKDDNNNFIIYEDTQFIKVINTVDPVILTQCNDTTICTYDVNCRPIPISLTINASDDCTAADQLLYRYKVDFDSDGTIDLERAGIGERTATGTWPLGNHIIKWEVEDRCGNTAKCQYKVNLLNCKNPTAYCLSDVSIGLVPMDTNGDGVPDTKMVEVWASDVDAGSYHNCGYPVKLSFSRDTSDKSRVYTCDSVGPRTVELWVTDANGNTSFCRTRIIVQDDPNKAPLCPNTVVQADVDGIIKSHTGSEVENVKVDLINSNALSATTNFNGEYAFTKMKVGGNYIISPLKNDDWLNGVTTADIVKIQKHILGIEELDTPYKMIAADVNNSGAVSTKDISDLRKLILGISTTIPTNTSWKFIDELYNFASVATALDEQYPTSYNISQLNSDMHVNFVAVKIGDVNNSAKTRGFGAGQSRDNHALSLYCENISMQAGKEYEIDVIAENMENYSGVQFTIEFQNSKVEVLDILSTADNAIKSENFSMLNAGRGKVSLSWNGELANHKKFMKIKVLAKENIDIADVLYLGSSVTPAISIAANESSEGKVNWSVRGISKTDFIVLQNEPNPWKDKTSIGMMLNESGPVTLTVYDLTGKVHYQATQQMQKGFQEWILENKQLGVSGVLYYQVDFGQQTATKRMVVIE